MKIVLWIVGIVVAALVLLVTAAAVLIHPNDFRGRISAEVEQSLHRKLEIGDIGLSLFPTLGVRLKDVRLGNAPGFGDEPMAQVGGAALGVRLLPLLFQHRAEVSSVSLNDLRLVLLKQADGRSNWDDLIASRPAAAPAQAQGAAPAAAKPSTELAQIGGIDISNASIRYTDQRAKKSYALDKLDLSTGSIAPGKPFDFKLAFSAALAEPAVKADVAVSAKLTADLSNKIYDARNLQASIDAAGAGVPGGRQQLKLGGSVQYDGGKGSFKLADGKLKLANLDISASLDGSGLDGAAPQIAGPLTVAPFNPGDTLKALGMEQHPADSSALKQAGLTARLLIGKTSARLDNLVLKLDQSTLGGSAGLASFSEAALRFDLKLDQIDLDRYLAQARRNPVAAPGGAAKAGEGDDTPLPLDKLDGINASGTLAIGRLKAKNLRLNDVTLRLAAAKGAQKTAGLDASLYGGTLSSVTRIGPGARPTVAEVAKLSGISAGPLLQDFMGKDYVSGQGNFSMDVTAAGHTLGEIKHSLNGTVSAALRDGAVKGFNLAQIIRQGQALAGGQVPEQGAGNQTDFSSLTASGRISNGVLRSDDLNAASPLLRLTGAGQVDLANSTLDYTAKPTVVNTASGQGGKTMAQLQGITIPVRVYGPFGAPRYQLDVASALQQQAVQKLTQKLGGQKGNDIVNTLQNLFNKK